MFECFNEDKESSSFSFKHSLIPTFEHFFCASTVATTIIAAATMRPKNPSRRHFANAASSSSAIHRPNASATIAAKAKMPHSARILTSELSIRGIIHKIGGSMRLTSPQDSCRYSALSSQFPLRCGSRRIRFRWLKALWAPKHH